MQKILDEILAIESGNIFLKYIVGRVQDDDYRGWHISQHNRYDMDDILIILREIYAVAESNNFSIPPGDYDKDVELPTEYANYGDIVNRVHAKMDRGTINSLKKNFFPDLEKMKLLVREKIALKQGARQVLHGRLTDDTLAFINSDLLTDRYKKFTDAIDKLFGSKISELAEMIHLSDYANDPISIYEFMFIFSDNSDDIDKIKLLDSYRNLSKSQQRRVIKLVKKYADPRNFSGDKTAQRDFHNWKNQAQQILGLFKTTVYFEVDRNKYFRLNIGATGFFQEPTRRSVVPKREYFSFHRVEKKDKFELHHIVPISSARNKEEAKMVDDYRNLIYIHRSKHKRISRGRGEHVVLDIDDLTARFSNFELDDTITAINRKDTFYSVDNKKIQKISAYNADLLKAIFEFEV